MKFSFIFETAKFFLARRINNFFIRHFNFHWIKIDQWEKIQTIVDTLLTRYFDKMLGGKRYIFKLESELFLNMAMVPTKEEIVKLFNVTQEEVYNSCVQIEITHVEATINATLKMIDEIEGICELEIDALATVVSP